MWQEIAVLIILALGAGFTLWGFYGRLTGKSACCGGGCTCKGSCGEKKPKRPQGKGQEGARRCTVLG